MTPIDQYIFSKPVRLREVLDFLNEHILLFDTRIHATLKWKVPYYSGKGMLCYLNVTKDEKVELNYAKGYLFHSEVKSLIEFRGRTVVGGLVYTDLSEINLDVLNVTLAEAIRIDNV